jgi:hypothetical protein
LPREYVQFLGVESQQFGEMVFVVGDEGCEGREGLQFGLEVEDGVAEFNSRALSRNETATVFCRSFLRRISAASTHIG